MQIEHGHSLYFQQALLAIEERELIEVHLVAKAKEFEPLTRG